jgi:hypothetical protein
MAIAKSKRMLSSVFIMTGAALPIAARGAPEGIYWTGLGDGSSWNDDLNWVYDDGTGHTINVVPGLDGYTHPTWISNGASVVFPGTAAGGALTGNSIVMLTIDSSSMLTQNSGHLTAANSFDERVGLTARGTLVISGGTHDAAGIVLGSNSGSVGYGSLVGAATVNAIAMTVGFAGQGSFTQTAGVNNVNFLDVGAVNGAGSGTFTLSGGTLTSVDQYIGGSSTAGVFNQSGGTNNTEQLKLGYAHVGEGGVGNPGTYTISGGMLNISTGATLYGGSKIIQSGSNTLVNLTYADGIVLLVGDGGSASTYEIQGGTLSAQAAIGVAYDSSTQGSFTQSGGSVGAGGLFIGHSGFGGSGTYTMSGGTLSIGTASGTVNECKFIQTGGLASLSGVGGTGSISVGGGAGTAVLGTLNLTQNSVTLSNRGTLNISGTATIGALVATNGGVVNFLSGSSGSTRAHHSVDSLTISGTSLVNIHHDQIATFTSPTTIKSYLANAFDPAGNADWGQPGLVSDVAKANPTKYSVGYAYSEDQSAQDAGISFSASNQTVVRAVLAGDANMDGTVDFFDTTQVLGYKYNTGQPASYTDGDLNYDGVVDFFDTTVVHQANYNTGEHYGPSHALTRLLAGHRALAGAASSADGPRFVYDPATGDVVFRTGGARVAAGDGRASYVCSLILCSESGDLLPQNASAALAESLGATLDPTMIAGALVDGTGFADGIDLGRVLPPGLDPFAVQADLVAEYQILGSPAQQAPVVIPEPVCLGAVGIGAATLLRRRKRRAH